MIIIQLLMLRDVIRKHISSILLMSDCEFARKRLGKGGLYGFACNLSHRPALFARFRLLSLRRLRRLSVGMMLTPTS